MLIYVAVAARRRQRINKMFAIAGMLTSDSRYLVDPVAILQTWQAIDHRAGNEIK